MTQTPESLSNALADKYRLERELGQGGMAVVYLATDLKHDRRVALKVMRSEMKGVLGPRFAREIKMAARLQHPHICSVYDSGETPQGELWYTMPFIEGESLRDRLTGEPRLPINTAVRIAREAAQGLEYAHKHGTIHRDIKPENILLTEDGKTLVADFGIAKAFDSSSGGPIGPPSAAGGVGTALTEAGVSIGTPAYMPPEQRMGEQVTAASDVFSLGAVLYEMLAGERAAAMTSMQSLLAQMSDPAPRVKLKRTDVSSALDKVVQTAMNPDPSKRYQTMAAFDAALEGAVSGEYRSVSSTSSGRKVAGGAVALVILALVIGAWLRFHGARQHEVVTVLPFKLPEAAGDSTLAYFTGSINEDLRRIIPHVSGMGASTEAAVANVAGGRVTTAEIAQRMGAAIVMQPSASWRADSTIALSFVVSRPPARQSVTVEFQGTPQWIVDHRDSLVNAVLTAGGRPIDHDEAASLVRWGIGTTSAPAYIRYFKYWKASYLGNLNQDQNNWMETLYAWQDTLLTLDPRFIDALSDKALYLVGSPRSVQYTTAQLDSLRGQVGALVGRLMQLDATHPLTLRASGYHSLMINDTASAIRTFTEAARVEPVFQLLTDLCDLELNRTRPSQPLPQSCVDMSRVDSLNPISLQNFSWMMLDAGRVDAALGPAKRLVEITPNQTTFRGPLIEVLQRLGRDEEALVQLRLALASSPNDRYLQSLMIQVQGNLGMTNEALALAEKKFAAHPDNPADMRQLAYALSAMKRDDDAIALVRRFIAPAPKVPGGHGILGGILWNAGRFDESLAEFRLASELDPNNAGRLAVLATRLRLAGKTGEAQGIVDKYQQQLAGAVGGYLEQARQLAWLGRDAASVTEYQRGMGSDTLNASRWNSIGYAQILAGQLDSALPTMQQAMRLDSFDVSVLSNMALLQSEQGQAREAAQQADRMRARRPLDHSVMAQQIWFRAHAGDMDGAKGMLDTLRQRMQRNGVSDVPLVIAFAGVGDTVNARAALRRSVESRDYGWTDFSLNDPLFRVLRGTPEYAEAVRAFRQAGDK